MNILIPEKRVMGLERICLSQKKQFEILKYHIPEDYEGKIILQLPNNLLISRYILLPTTARKKVSMMIPFQLDDTLPLNAENSHYVYMLNKKGTSTKCHNINYKPK